jgi:hypothetical protein
VRTWTLASCCDLCKDSRPNTKSRTMPADSHTERNSIASRMSSYFSPNNTRRKKLKLHSREQQHESQKITTTTGQRRAGMTAQVATDIAMSLRKGLMGSGNIAHSSIAASLLARRALGQSLSLREKLFLWLEEPAASGADFWVGLSMWALLGLYAIFNTVETLQRFTDAVGPLPLVVTKCIFNGLFTLEAIVRIATYQPIRYCHRNFILVLDVLTVVPFWVRVFSGAMTPERYLTYGRTDSGALEWWIKLLESMTSTMA